MKATSMYIYLEGAKFFAHHGVDPQETIVGANFIIDLKLRTDFTQDVYKRQPLRTSVVLRLIVSGNSFFKALFLQGFFQSYRHASVSYTHLDVYKRQILGSWYSS